jgi:hypothetical protein
MRRDLERGLNPLLSLFPRYLFGSALLSQLAATVIHLSALQDIARGVLGTAVVVGVVALAVLVVDYASAPVGSLAYRLRGLASAGTGAMVVGFTLAWNLVDSGASTRSVFVVELVSFLGALAVAREAVRLRPESPYGLDAADQDVADPEDWLLRRIYEPDGGLGPAGTVPTQPMVPTVNSPSA